MSLYLRWGGALLLLVSALLFGREYSKYAKRRKTQMAEFIALITHIKGRISRFLSPTSELLSGFESEELERCGFLSAFSESSDLGGALDRSKTVLGEPFRNILSEFFSGFGKNYLDGEIKRIEHYTELLSEEEKREKEELSKSEKLTKTLLFAAALALAILLI